MRVLAYLVLTPLGAVVGAAVFTVFAAGLCAAVPGLQGNPDAGLSLWLALFLVGAFGGAVAGGIAAHKWTDPSRGRHGGNGM